MSVAIRSYEALCPARLHAHAVDQWVPLVSNLALIVSSFAVALVFPVAHPMEGVDDDEDVAQMRLFLLGASDGSILPSDPMSPPTPPRAFGLQRSKEHGHLTALSSPKLKISGSVNPCHLPRHLVRVDLSNTGIAGPFPLTALPDGLEVLNISQNRLVGPVDLTRLPPALNTLALGHNRFIGTVDITELPCTLQSLFLHSNKFTRMIAHPAHRVDAHFSTSTLRRLALSPSSDETADDTPKLDASLVACGSTPDAVEFAWPEETPLRHLNVAQNPWEHKFPAEGVPNGMIVWRT